MDVKRLNIGWWFKLVFSDRLKTAMKNKNMTVSELARRSGIHTHTIYLYLEPEKYGRNINLLYYLLENFDEMQEGEDE